uniref:Uncharacterized protein n=1 Tax=Micromonas pusilla TaxID=38833 RepID=A0A7S0D9M5_MICPS
MSASAVGASYGDLLAPPPSYADSMMFSRPPEGFARSAAASAADHSFAQSQSQSHAGMMRTVALDPGGGGGGGGAFSHSDAPRDDREVTSPRGRRAGRRYAKTRRRRRRHRPGPARRCASCPRATATATARKSGPRRTPPRSSQTPPAAG